MLRSLLFCFRSSLRSLMPIVSHALVSRDYQLSLVKSGSVKMLSAYLPDGALVTLHNLRNFHGKAAKGSMRTSRWRAVTGPRISCLSPTAVFTLRRRTCARRTARNRGRSFT